MSESQVYWWLMLDNINTWFVVMFLACLCALVVLGFVWFLNSGNDDELAAKSRKGFLFILVAVAVLSFPVVFIPTSKDYAMIKILPKIVNSDFEKQVPADMQSIYDIAKQALKEKLK